MKPFKVALAGCGSMSRKWVEYAQSRQDTEIVALVDISEDNARVMRENYNLNAGIYADIEDAIRGTEANLVFDVTIPAVHKEITTKALALGCHVFGEKPMGASLEDAQAMLEAALEAERTYAVMQNRRYLKQIRAFRDLITSGAIGQPGFICADFFLGPHFGGFREEMDSPLILDMAIHTFDQARFITGQDPVSVYCQEFNPKGSWYKGDAAAVCIFELADGSVFCYRGSWAAEGVPTSWESSWRITGSKGTAIWDGENIPFAEMLRTSSEQKFMHDHKRVDATLDWNGREGHQGCLDEMFLALIEGRKPETDCTDNIKSVSMVYSALESARKGQKIVIENHRLI